MRCCVCAGEQQGAGGSVASANGKAEKKKPPPPQQPEAEAEAPEPEGPLLEELLLVPVSKLRLLTHGKKGSAMAVVSRVTGATIRKEPKPPKVEAEAGAGDGTGEEEEEEGGGAAGKAGEGEEEGQGQGEERLVKVHVLSAQEPRLRAAVDALNAVLEGTVRRRRGLSCPYVLCCLGGVVGWSVGWSVCLSVMSQQPMHAVSTNERTNELTN